MQANQAGSPVNLSRSEEGVGKLGLTPPQWVIDEEARRVAEAELAWTDVAGFGVSFGQSKAAYIKEYVGRNFSAITWTATGDGSAMRSRVLSKDGASQSTGLPGEQQ